MGLVEVRARWPKHPWLSKKKKKTPNAYFFFLLFTFAYYVVILFSYKDSISILPISLKSGFMGSKGLL